MARKLLSLVLFAVDILNAYIYIYNVVASQMTKKLPQRLVAAAVSWYRLSRRHRSLWARAARTSHWWRLKCEHNPSIKRSWGCKSCNPEEVLQSYRRVICPSVSRSCSLRDGRGARFLWSGSLAYVPGPCFLFETWQWWVGPEIPSVKLKM